MRHGNVLVRRLDRKGRKRPPEIARPLSTTVMATPVKPAAPVDEPARYRSRSDGSHPDGRIVT
jgi:hypothetical protein